MCGPERVRLEKSQKGWVACECKLQPHLLVDKTIVSATGSLGQSVGAWVQPYVSDRTHIQTRTAEIQSYWDEYQNELIRKFYGNEPSAKKPLPVYNVPVGSIVVPGLTGRTSL